MMLCYPKTLVRYPPIKKILHGVSNPRKSRIQYCERSELRLHFEWTKVFQNVKNGPFWREFETESL